MKHEQDNLIQQIKSYYIKESQEMRASEIYAILVNQPDKVERLALAYTLGYMRAMQTKTN